MPTYFQADRALSVTTPLPANSLLLVGVSGYEGISTLFRFDFQLLAENSTPIAFEKLLGQKTTAKIHLQDNEQRFVSGVVSRVSQGSRDADFTTYRMEVVPQFWFLTNRQQSRIFQFISVPDILKKVLAGLDVIYEIQGTFEQRNYCVQYRETDFEFASRLMEEEGIYYFFKHTSTGHTMVLANTPQSHTEISPAKVIFEEITGGNRPDERISIWEKSQELRSGKTTLWDFNFEFPGKHLEADKSIVDSVLAGTVTHPFKLANNDKMELYDFPGDYATRFDGVDRGGSPRPPELQKIFQDNKRTAGIRMQEEASQGLVIQGSSSCPRLTAGHRFTLERHFNADGVYVLTGVEIRATMSGDYRSGEGAKLDFESGFTCVPLALPFRPARVTPPPRVFGTQTATVVGPAGDEIFTDKYGRVKVQFHWDREGKNDGDSSCWLRVATLWAGKGWGMIHIPRVGQEVLVDFVDGRVDEPIVIGSVYNPGQMPPYTLPGEKTKSGIKSRSTLNGSPANFNQFMFEDLKGSEMVNLHAEKDLGIEVENDETHWVGHDRIKTIDHDETTHVKHDQTHTVDHDQTITVHNNQTITVDQNRDVTITQGNDSLTIKMGNSTTKISAGKSETEAMQSIELKVGQSSIKLDPTGVTIKGLMVKVEGQVQVQVKAPMVQVNADAILTLKGGVTMIN